MVDRNVLEFIRGHVFDPTDFVIRSDGVCRLNPEMARCVAEVVLQGAVLKSFWC
jgi:CRISPR-associated protein Cas1